MVIDTGVLYCLADPSMLHWNLSLSKAIAAETAMLSNFLWNDLWTFKDCAVNPATGHRLKRLGKFNLICLAGLALSLVLLNVQVYQFHFNVYLANLIAIFVASLWNFGMNLKFAWGKPSPGAARPISPPN